MQGNGAPPGAGGGANGGAQWGFVTEYRNAPFALFYSRSGCGKTMQCVRTLPNAYFVGPKNGVAAVAVGAVGFMPRFVDESLKTIEQVNAFVTGAIKGAYGMSFPEMVEKKLVDGLAVDDESILAGRTEQAARNSHSGNGGVSYAAYADVMVVLQGQRDFMRDMSVPAVLNCHEEPAWMDENERVLGGPKLPGKRAPKEFPPITDACYRFVRDPMLPPEPFGWNVRICVDQYSPDWYTKDKYHIFGRSSPLNVREHWAAAGLRLSRAPGLEWQDDVAEEFAQAITSGAPWQKVWPWLVENRVVPRFQQMGMPKRPGDNIVEWTRSDAFARVEIRMYAAQRAAYMAGRV